MGHPYLDFTERVQLVDELTHQHLRDHWIAVLIDCERQLFDDVDRFYIDAETMGGE
jgi:hypothetical protein